MATNSEDMPTRNRSTPWLKWGIGAAVVLAAGFWLFNAWDYGPLNSFRGFCSWGHNGIGGHMMGYGMGIGMVLFWGLVILALVSLISGSLAKRQDPSQPASQADNALLILKKRYARGDIDKTEFDAMRRDLDI